MSEAQNFWLWLLRYGYASAPQPQPKIPEESMINLLNLTDTTLPTPRTGPFLDFKRPIRNVLCD